MIEGIGIGESKLLIRMFLDDTVSVVKAKEAALDEVWNSTQRFCALSRQSIGISKTEAVWINRAAQPDWTRKWGWNLGVDP